LRLGVVDVQLIDGDVLGGLAFAMRVCADGPLFQLAGDATFLARGSRRVAEAF